MAGVLSLLALLLVFPSSCLGFRSPLSVFKRFKESTRSFSNECLGTTRPVIPIDSSDFALDVHMPGVTPKQSDTYFCMSMRLPVDEEAFVIDFKPRASMDTVHHMLLFGCNMPSSTGSYWVLVLSGYVYCFVASLTMLMILWLGVAFAYTAFMHPLHILAICHPCIVYVLQSLLCFFCCKETCKAKRT